MRPTLRQLQYLVAVADTGKFHEAARRLNVSQPSLSAQIAEAEQQLGAVLVERGRHGAFMTPLGEEVVRRARAILIQVEDLKAFTLRPAGEVARRSASSRTTRTGATGWARSRPSGHTFCQALSVNFTACFRNCA